MRKLLLCIIALTVILGASVYSLDGRITEVRGKVEVRSGFGSWRTARVGDVLPQGGSISTGFNSRAEINLGSSVVQISQLTRMTLEELAESQGTRTTSLNLKVGRVKAEVKTTEGISHNFKLKSSVSTAAVRGTTFSYDGENLEVEDGTVNMQNNAGQSRSVGSGEETQVTGGGLAPPPSAEDALESDSSVSPYTAPVQDAPPSMEPPVSEPTPTTGTITIQWESFYGA